jgi:hypothetical protein
MDVKSNLEQENERLKASVRSLNTVVSHNVTVVKDLERRNDDLLNQA